MSDLFHVIWSTLLGEFSDISDATQATRVVVRLLVAVILGAALGYERERKGKAAGLRTHMLVSLGAALFVLVPLQAGMPPADVSRVIQGIVTGIGFLGAGAIIKVDNDALIKGLTSAANIWLAAAIGIAAGLGQEMIAVFSTVLALFILSALHRMERRMGTLIDDAPDPQAANAPEDTNANP
jgi:putative Mg2+ transporter-C (MgtC) family protein